MTDGISVIRLYTTDYIHDEGSIPYVDPNVILHLHGLKD